ncbi:MAG TPA: hypothetical protein V6C58_19645 [Allocoleopsis sp.]
MKRNKKFKVPHGEQFGRDRLSYYHGGISVKDYTVITLEEQDEGE